MATDESSRPPAGEPMKRADMNLLRRSIEQGWYTNPDPRAAQAVVAEVLRVMQTTTSPRTKLTAARTHAALMRLTLQTYETLAKIEAMERENDLPPSDVIRLPAGGPWGQPTPPADDPPADPPPAEPVDGPDGRPI